MAGYRDAACSTRVRYAALDSCTSDRSALETIAGSCPSARRVYPLERMPGSAIHVPFTTGCQPPAGTPLEVGVLGPEVPPAELVELTERVE